MSYNGLSTTNKGIKMKDKQGRYSLRVDAQLMDWIKAEAESNHRTIIGQITMMLELAKEEIESADA